MKVNTNFMPKIDHQLIVLLAILLWVFVLCKLNGELHRWFVDSAIPFWYAVDFQIFETCTIGHFWTFSDSKTDVNLNTCYWSKIFVLCYRVLIYLSENIYFSVYWYYIERAVSLYTGKRAKNAQFCVFVVFSHANTENIVHIR